MADADITCFPSLDYAARKMYAVDGVSLFSARALMPS